MRKTTGRPPSATSDEALRQRVAHLANVLFLGNHHRMAEALDVGRSTVTKTLSGDRAPGDTMLNALAKHHRVNPEWLLRGEGDPLMPTSAGTLPVANALLPGAPNEYPQMLSGDRHSVAAMWERDSRYWFRLGFQMPKCLRETLSMLPGDMLLIETHDDHILRPDVYIQHLCALHVQAGTAEIYVLGRVVKEDSSLRATVYDSSVPWDLKFTREAMIRHGARQPAAHKSGKVRRKVSRIRPKEKSPSQVSTRETMEESKAEVHGILGVVLTLERPVLLSA